MGRPLGRAQAYQDSEVGRYGKLGWGLMGPDYSLTTDLTYVLTDLTARRQRC